MAPFNYIRRFIFFVIWFLCTACMPTAGPVAVSRIPTYPILSTPTLPPTNTPILPSRPFTLETTRTPTEVAAQNTSIPTQAVSPAYTATWTPTPTPNVTATPTVPVLTPTPSATPLVDRIPPAEVQLLGQAGGYTGALALQDGYVLLGMGLRLLVLDVNTPTHPELIGRSAVLPGVPLAIVTAETTAYVGLDNGEIIILDMADLTSPQLVGSLDEMVHAGGSGRNVRMTLEDHFIYLVDENQNNLSVIDVADSAHPVRVAEYVFVNGYVQDVAVRDNVVYTAVSKEGVVILEHTPTNTLLEVGHLAGQAASITIAGDLAFVVDGAHTLTVFDLANLQQPRVIGRYQTDAMMAMDVIAMGNRVYISDQSGTIGTSRIFSQYGPPVRPGNVQIVDMTTPAAPRQIGSFTTSAQIWSLTVDADYLYVTDGDLLIVDVTDTAVPTVVGSYQTPGEIYDVVVVGNDAYTAAGNRGLRLFDVNDPTAPVMVGFQMGTPGHALRLLVNAGYAYVTNDFQMVDFTNPITVGLGLRVVSVANPLAPSEVAFYPILHESSFALNDVIAVDPYLMLAQTDGLHILDTTDPTHLLEVGTIETDAKGVAVANGYAFLTGKAGLQIMDVSNLMMPVVVSTGYAGYGPRADYDGYLTEQIAVVGTYAFLDYVVYAGDGQMHDLCEVDVADLLNPVLIGCFPIGQIRRIHSGETAVYVSADDMLYIIDAAFPQNIHRVSFGFPVWNVDEHGGDIYVAGGSAGLIILHLDN